MSRSTTPDPATPSPDPSTPDPATTTAQQAFDQLTTMVRGELFDDSGKSRIVTLNTAVFDDSGRSRIQLLEQDVNRLKADVSSLQGWRNRVDNILSAITGDPVGGYKWPLIWGVVTFVLVGWVMLVVNTDGGDGFDAVQAWLFAAAAGVIGFAIACLFKGPRFRRTPQSTTPADTSTDSSTSSPDAPSSDPDPTLVAGTPPVTSTSSGAPAPASTS